MVAFPQAHVAGAADMPWCVSNSISVYQAGHFAGFVPAAPSYVALGPVHPAGAGGRHPTGHAAGAASAGGHAAASTAHASGVASAVPAASSGVSGVAPTSPLASTESSNGGASVRSPM